MKIKKIIAGSLVSISALLSANAFAADDMVPCPEGCFCYKFGGKISNKLNVADNCKTSHPTPMRRCAFNGVSSWNYIHPNGQNKTGKLLCASSEQKGSLDYYFDDFAEVYSGADGYYGVMQKKEGTAIHNDMVPMFNVQTSKIKNFGAVYNCPRDYPQSDAGAKTVFECFKMVNGKKEFYMPFGFITLDVGDGSLAASDVAPSSSSYDVKKWIWQGEEDKRLAGLYRQKAVAGGAIVLPTPVSSSGKVFSGWCTDKSFKDCTAAGTKWSGAVGNLKYYAKWLSGKMLSSDMGQKSTAKLPSGQVINQKPAESEVKMTTGAQQKLQSTIKPKNTKGFKSSK